MMNEAGARELIVARARSLYDRRYAHGSSGNLSMRVDDGVLITPTGSCLGRLDPARIAKVDADGRHVAGDAPSKEAFLHLALYARRPGAQAIVHLHCTFAVAVSCMAHDDPRNVLPPLTAYSVMRIGTLPLVPYFPPGDRQLAAAVGETAREHHAMLLANHGPIVAGGSLDEAVDNAEELEATARLALLLHGRDTVPLDAPSIEELHRRFPS